MTLEKVRKEINAIDAQLIPLLKQRLQCSLKVAQVKREQGIPVLDVTREEAILQKVKEQAEPYGNYVAGIYRGIMDVSKELQHDTMANINNLASEILTASPLEASDYTGVVATAGVEGAFADQAARRLYPNAQIRYVNTFEQVFEQVESGQVLYGVVPVENSSAGSVSAVYDLLLKYRHYIVAGYDLKISQNLLGVPGATLEDVREVYSHPQALAQSESFLRRRGYRTVEYNNTATAAQMIARLGDKSKAAIGSPKAASLYGLEVLAPNIQNLKYNCTRFIAISKRLIICKDANKVSLVFSVPHVTGSLYRTLNRFATHGLNLTKIESRTASEGGFNYLFYLDFQGQVRDLNTVRLLCDLAEELPEFTFLGNYKEIPYEG